MSTKISQRQAREWRKRALAAEGREEGRFSRWSTDNPSGQVIGHTDLTPIEMAIVKTARVLRHAVVVVPYDNTRITFYALPASRQNQP